MNSNTRFRPYIYLYPILIGVAAFFIIAGPRFLNPMNVAWISGGDPLQHYLGWAFYRNGPWTWPIGLNPLYGMDFSNSIVFTDSIPLLAIPFKAIEAILPRPFHYFGIWVLLCFVLQAYFASRLIGLITKNVTFQCLGSLLFVFSPPLLFRLSLHESLMGQFLLLAALYLNLKPSAAGNQLPSTRLYLSIFYWVILLGVALSTHFYLAVMVAALWLSDFADRIFIRQQADFAAAVIELLSVLAFMVFILWQVGYFAIEVGSGATSGYGEFRTNLIALFNSHGWSYWIRPINLHDPVEVASGEGLQFLGTGTIFLLLCGIASIVRGKVHLLSLLRALWSYRPLLLVALLVLTLISITNHIGIGGWNVRLPIPDLLVKVLSNVRSASRLFWPLYYSIVLGILFCVIRSYGAKVALTLLLIAATLQILDTSAGWLPTRHKISITSSSQLRTPMQNPFWNEAAAQYKNVVINYGSDNWEAMGDFASKNRLATNIVYMARADKKKEDESFARIGQQVHEGPLDLNSLYIFRDWKIGLDRIQFNPQQDLLARIDGINVLAPGWKVCASCPKIPQELEIAQIAPELKIGQIVAFTQAGDGRTNYLLEGWGFTEPWGTWATDSHAKLVMPMPKGDPTKLLIRANAFLSSTHSQQIIDIVVNGVRVADQMVLAKPMDNLLEVRLPRGAKTAGEPVTIEFRSHNAISPRVAGLGADDRKLGIGLVSIEFAR